MPVLSNFPRGLHLQERQPDDQPFLPTYQRCQAGAQCPFLHIHVVLPLQIDASENCVYKL